MARLAGVQVALRAAVASLLVWLPGAEAEPGSRRHDDGDRPFAFGADLRVRHDVIWQPFLGLRDVPFDATTTFRALGHLDARPSREVRAFLQLGSMWAFGRSLPERNVDEDRFDLQQGFADLVLLRVRHSKRPSGEQSILTLRGGRQTVSLGSSRLVGIRDGTNVRRAFDGMRLLFESRALDAQLLALSSPELRRGVLDDGPALDELLFGGHATARLRDEVSLDAYYLGYRNVASEWLDAKGGELRHSFGARVFGKAGIVDYDGEAVVQVGSVGESNIAAWTIATDQGVALARTADLDLRLGLRANVASGDGRPDDGTLGTFSPLFPRLPYFSELALISPSNVVDVHPLVTLSAFGRVRLQLDVDVFFRHHTRDAIYTSPNTPLAQPRGGRFSGTQLNARVELHAADAHTLTLCASYFDVSSALDDAGAHDTGYLGLWYDWTL